MWYTKPPRNDSPIWLANRDEPIPNDSRVFTIDNTGLKITQDGGNPIHLFSRQSTTINSSDMKLVLENSGNLVLQASNGENEVFWQSFDHTADTLLPEMKLGVNRGRNWSLRSWLTQSIPASGAFTLKWDPEEERLFVRLRERVLWTVTGEKLGKLLHSDTRIMNYNFTHVSNGDEQYVYYTLFIDQYTPDDWLENPILKLLSGGTLSPGSNRVNLFDSKTCAGDETENGCERRKGPKCRNKGDKYEIRYIITRDKDSLNNARHVHKSLSIDDCKNICWNDCKYFAVKAAMDLGCQFLSGPDEQGVLDGTLYQVIIRNRSSRITKLDMEFNLYSNGSNDHNTICHPGLFEKTTVN